MKKISTLTNIEYTFDPNRSGAKYTLDGIHYMNGGEFAEVATKVALGYAPHKDANTAYSEGSDIPELRASVKSSKATLVNMKLANGFEESIEVYFKNTHSTCFIYTVLLDDMTTLYIMDAAEFREFIRRFATLNERGFIRFKATSGKTIQWLEERV